MVEGIGPRRARVVAEDRGLTPSGERASRRGKSARSQFGDPRETGLCRSPAARKSRRHVVGFARLWNEFPGAQHLSGQIKKLLHQVDTSELKVIGDVVQDIRQCSNSKTLMVRNGHMVLAVFGRCQPDVRTFLSRWLITELPQCPDEFVCRKITRQFHGWSISSRTICKRMIFGACPSSK